MEIEIRMKICRLLEFAGQDPSYSERVGIRDTSFYEESRIRAESLSDSDENKLK